MIYVNGKLKIYRNWIDYDSNGLTALLLIPLYCNKRCYESVPVPKSGITKDPAAGTTSCIWNFQTILQMQVPHYANMD
jgi:hypothetical protein